MSEYIIEKAKPEDAAAILAYLRKIGGESDNLTFGAEGVPFTEDEEAAYIKNLNESKSNVLYLVKHKGKIIGNGSLNNLPNRMSHRSELGISVLKEYWGKGVGTLLMDALIAFGRNANVEMISLEVRSDNERGIRLYRKFGFQKVATYPGYMKINGQLIDYDFMYLKLR